MPFKTPHPLYSIWQGMRRRCDNPNFKQWDRYGGRGITVCPEWDSFHQFVSDMGPRPSRKHSIDRIDNDQGYSPSNCRWATKKEQQRNRSDTRRLSFDGVEYVVAELSELSGLKSTTIEDRHAAGLCLSDCLNPKRRPYPGVKGTKWSKPRTACKRGHEFTPENTSYTKEGFRICRTCHRAKVNRQRMAKRGVL